MMAASCSVDKYIPEGEHMLTGVAVTCDEMANTPVAETG